MLTTLQEENIHWNLNFANSSFAKFESRSLLQFWKSLHDSLYDWNSKSRFAYILFSVFDQSEPGR